jgi:hypothetical protein
MRIWSKLVACAMLSVPLARWMGGRQAAHMEHYRTLDRDALLAALQAQNETNTWAYYLATFLLFALCTFAVVGLAKVIERVAGVRADRND